MQNQLTYQIGATQFAVGLSATVTVRPGSYVGGYFLRHISGGTLALVQGPSSIVSQGYVLEPTQPINIAGPSTFFLAAAGATAIVGLAFKYSEGYSARP